MALTSFLYLPPLARSVDYRAYLAPVAGVTFLRRFLERLHISKNELRVVVLCGDEPKIDVVTEIGRVAGTEVVPTFRSRPIEAFAEAAEKTCSEQAAFFSMELSLAPDDLLVRVLRHHLACGNDYTAVTGLPEECTPAVYAKSLLLSLLALLQSLPFFPPYPRLAMDMLLRLPEKPFPVASTPFNGAREFGPDTEGLPNSARIATPEDMEVVQDILSGRVSGGLARPLEKLYQWKQIREERREQARRVLRSRIGYLAPPGKLTRPEKRPRARVLYISNPSAFSGGEASLCQLAAHVDRRRFDLFALLALRGHFARRLEQLGVEVVCPDRDFVDSDIDNFLWALATLGDIAPDVVHLNAIVGMHMVYAAIVLGIPIVQHLRVVDPDPVLVKQASAADAVITVSDFVRKEVLKCEIAPQRVRVIHSGVDPEYFRPDAFDKLEMRQKYGLPLTAKIMLMVARFAPNKRHDLILRAASLLRSS
ncbi:MAG TPA: glycosyltransferase, partial [Ktedonobacteraceae bacterium]|nr:glycosyltransferase [Ktedonobacteraceae bacterium]